MVKCCIVFFLFFHLTTFAQDRNYATSCLNRLASKSFNGRGYVKDGVGKAADFIAEEFKKHGLLPVNGSYFQHFSFPVNTFPGKVKVKVGNKNLIPGKDFIVSPAATSLKGKFPVKKVDLPFETFSFEGNEENFLLIDKTGFEPSQRDQLDSMLRNPPDTKGILIGEPEKLVWSVTDKQFQQVFIRVLNSALPEEKNTICVDIKNKYIESFPSKNVIGMIRGNSEPDSFIVFTAHYDHLGMMGKKALFAGANDNASGTSVLLDLARHYAIEANRPEKSMLFIAFAGEEAGLLGSKYYTENPLIPLSQIRFLVNMDLMGTGDNGLMVVNGEIHPEEFGLLTEINNKNSLVKEIGKRGKARNSDHYHFSERGVPAFFLYTTGGSTAYHDVHDVPANLTLPEYEDIFRLITEFVEKLDP
jgi:hypothetical protein